MSRERPTDRGRAPSILTPMICRRAAPGRKRPSSCTKASRAIISRSAWPRKIRRCRAFMRFGGNTAYVEGWALYAESLGYDDGLLHRSVSAVRQRSTTRCCARCGWSSTPASMPKVGRAIRRSSTCSTIRREPQTDATAEVERYIAIPSQALGYKIGQLTIQRLRNKAQAALGPKFDIREFHAAGARHRRASAADPRREDRPLDRGARRPASCRRAR